MSYNDPWFWAFLAALGWLLGFVSVGSKRFGNPLTGAITYILARMGLVTARWMLKHWRAAIIAILIVATVVSPTNDIPNMLLFALPMFVLYAISIVVAWVSGRERKTA